MKVVFLFLQGQHHVYHNAPVALQLALLSNDIEVVCISASEEHSNTINQVWNIEYFPENLKLTTLKLPLRYRYLNYKKKIYPSPNDTIKMAKKYIKDAEIIISTSHGTPKDLKKNKITPKKLIYQYHGCGDRCYGFEPGLKRFDYILVPGVYHQERLVEEDIFKKDETAIIGWPKLDVISKLHDETYNIFSENRPIIYYSPHWDPKLSSYDKFGKQILNYFAQSKTYNLIFAPHILVKHWSHRFNYDLQLIDPVPSNIHIDYNSENSVNGYYLKKADIFISDVSSLIYEWIAVKPRPSLFINAHEVDFQNDVNYNHWQYGPVISKMEDFSKALLSANEQDYITLQSNMVKKYIDNNNDPAVKAAESIMNWIN